MFETLTRYDNTADNFDKNAKPPVVALYISSASEFKATAKFKKCVVKESEIARGTTNYIFEFELDDVEKGGVAVKGGWENPDPAAPGQIITFLVKKNMSDTEAHDRRKQEDIAKVCAAITGRRVQDYLNPNGGATLMIEDVFTDSGLAHEGNLVEITSRSYERKDKSTGYAPQFACAE